MVAWWKANAEERREATPYRMGLDQERDEQSRCDMIKLWWARARAVAVASRPASIGTYLDQCIRNPSAEKGRVSAYIHIYNGRTSCPLSSHIPLSLIDGYS